MASGHDTGRYDDGALRNDLTIMFWSGTGNSYRVAQWIAASARQRGLSASVVPVDRAPDLPRPNTRWLGIVTPTHGFTAPWTVVRGLWRLGRAPSGARAFAIATRAGVKVGPMFLPGFEGSATLLMASILRLKGYQVVGTMGVDMPSSWLAVHPGFSKASAVAIEARARPKVERFANAILDKRTSFGGRLVPALGLALAPISFLYMTRGRFFLAKVMFASEECNGCGICAANCPQSAIRMKGDDNGGRGRPYWTYSCESCMRCMAFCPQEAIQAGHSWAGILYFLSSLAMQVSLVRRLQPRKDSPILFRACAHAAQYVGSLASAAAAYWAFDQLLRVRLINNVFANTTLTRLYRRYHEPETTLKDLGTEDYDTPWS